MSERDFQAARWSRERDLPPPNIWWHEAHGWHDHDHHLTHRPLALCIPAESRERMDAAEMRGWNLHVERLCEEGHGDHCTGGLDVMRLAYAIWQQTSYEPDLGRFTMYEDEGPDELARRIADVYEGVR